MHQFANRTTFQCLFFVGIASTVLSTANGQTVSQPESPTDAVDTGGLTIEAVAGWDDTVDTAAPVPLSFNISNYSGKDIDGDIAIFDPLSEQTATLGKVFIGQGGTSRFTSIRDLSTWHDCHAILSANGRVLWRRQLPIATGSDFDPHFNFVLFLDVQGRALPLKMPEKAQAYYNDRSTNLAPADGRPVRCLSAKPWQIPRHPGPLSPVQAVVFQDDETANELNHIQWRALAEWMCQGGTVFAPESSTLIPEQLFKASPLGQSPAVQLESFSTTRAGLGSLRAYSASLLAEDSQELRDQLTDTIAKLDKNDLVSAVRKSDHGYRDGNNSGRNRLRVIAFFGIYTLLSGVVPLVFFRMERKRIAMLTTAIVVVATVMAGLLGAFLRTSQGDLSLVTVTELGAGGAVEVANINVQSAGGRDTEVAVRGERADLQFTGQADNYGYYYNQIPTQKGYAPFTWQAGLNADEPDIYQINVPITPWGRRQLHATAYQPDWKGLDITLEFTPAEPNDEEVVEEEAASDPEESELAGFGFGQGASLTAPQPVRPAGKFSLRLVNHLPVGVTGCHLVIGIARQRQLHVSALDNLQRLQFVEDAAGNMPIKTVAHNTMEFQFQSLHQSLAPGADIRQTIPIRLHRLGDSRDMARAWPHGATTFRTLTHTEQNGVWIVGQLSAPATLRIDERRTDFLPDNAAHYFIQRVLPENMPDLSALLPSDTEPSELTDTE